MYHIIYSFSSDFVSNLKTVIRAETCSWGIYISDSIVVFKTVYPRTIVYLWLTNTMRMADLEDSVCCLGKACRCRSCVSLVLLVFMIIFSELYKLILKKKWQNYLRAINLKVFSYIISLFQVPRKSTKGSEWPVDVKSERPQYWTGVPTITLGVPYLVPYKTESILWHHYLLDLSKYMAYTTVFTGLLNFNFVDGYGR